LALPILLAAGLNVAAVTALADLAGFNIVCTSTPWQLRYGPAGGVHRG